MREKASAPAWVLYIIILVLIIILIVVVIQTFIRPSWESVTCEGKLTSTLDNLWSTAVHTTGSMKNIDTFFVPSCVEKIVLCDGINTKYKVTFKNPPQEKTLETAYGVSFLPCGKELTPAEAFYTVEITFKRVEVISQ
jgi:hypothetical protein